ncbi:nuA3 HAT complex component nto1 [Chytriomyces hyalinus]|nr:nuA3 HAT complex component nto1 [Chytriomyces hyalinus]
MRGRRPTAPADTPPPATSRPARGSKREISAYLEKDRAFEMLLNESLMDMNRRNSDVDGDAAADASLLLGVSRIVVPGTGAGAGAGVGPAEGTARSKARRKDRRSRSRSTSMPLASSGTGPAEEAPNADKLLPIEEQTCEAIAPNLHVTAQLRHVRLPLDSKSSSATRTASDSAALESMFDNEPPPNEFDIPTQLPSFNIVFSKPIPIPRYELLSNNQFPSTTFNASAPNSSPASSNINPAHLRNRTSRGWSKSELNEDMHSDIHAEDEDEYINGRPVGTKFKFKESQYFRFIEPSEDELHNRVEYDMDEQDKVWLQHQNASRHAQSSEPPVPAILFEFIMDRLEKEWFNLLKKVPKPLKDTLEPDDNNCAVCDDGECENSNAIVFCDGCNLAVHQDCYGVPFIPEGQWLCRKCMVCPERAVSCIFCPNEQGALKQTNNNKWAHIVCAQWIPEASFGNATYMEPIDAKAVPSSRYRLNCYVCERKKGACIQCSVKNCYASYHVTCARKCKFYMKMGLDEMKSFCDRHSPKEHKDQVDVEKQIFLYRRANNFSNVKFKPTPELEAELMHEFDGEVGNGTVDRAPHASTPLPQKATSSMTPRPHSPPSKRVRTVTNYAHASLAAMSATLHESGDSPRKRNRPNYVEDSNQDDDGKGGQGQEWGQQGPDDLESKHLKERDDEYKRLIAAPVVPLGVMKAVVNSIRGSSHIRGKNSFVEKCCRYWALKREGRRGAPLLKRLHLEPWTATTTAIQQDEGVRAKRMEVLRKIRNDLERVRMLSELVKKRERERLKRSQTQFQIALLFFHPLTCLLRPALEEIRRLDLKGMFEEPVDLEVVPDYLEFIKTPMDFETMHDKLEMNEYRSVDAFKSDFHLICHNAKTYNLPDTPWHRAADRLLLRAEPILIRLDEERAKMNVDAVTGCLADSFAVSLFSSPGDLGSSSGNAIPHPVASTVTPVSMDVEGAEDNDGNDTVVDTGSLEVDEQSKPVKNESLPVSIESPKKEDLAPVVKVKTPKKPTAQPPLVPSSVSPKRTRLSVRRQSLALSADGDAPAERIDARSPQKTGGISREALLLEDELLAKALQEQEINQLKQSPRYTRRSLPLSQAAQPTEQTLPEQLDAIMVSQATKRRGSLRSVGTVDTAPESVLSPSRQAPSSAKKTRKNSITAPAHDPSVVASTQSDSSVKNNAHTPKASLDLRLKRLIQDASSKNTEIHRRAAALSYASIYFEDTAAGGVAVSPVKAANGGGGGEGTLSTRRSSTRVAASASSNAEKTAGIFGAYPVLEDRYFELTDEILSVRSTRK